MAHHHYIIRWLLYFSLFVVSLLSCRQDPPVKTSVEDAIMGFYNEWKGTPYKIGGMTKEGIDCSAMTQRLYKDVFKVELPRRVVQQKVEGLPVSKDSLEAGDLIVFKGALFGRPHIGIFISHGDFLHASSSKGVTISNLSERYWKRKFRMARRLIDKHRRLILDQE